MIFQRWGLKDEFRMFLCCIGLISLSFLVWGTWGLWFLAADICVMYSCLEQSLRPKTAVSRRVELQESEGVGQRTRLDELLSV